MLYYEGLTCPVCQKSFKKGEDVVVCPHCGLPHHRACWLQENQCHRASDHGTEKQWSRETAVRESGYTPPVGYPVNPRICAHCFTKNAEFAEFCAHCGRPLGTADWHSKKGAENTYTPFNEPDARTNAEQEISAMVGVNTQYYLPRFRNIRECKSGGWNWAAFLLGPLWLFYRKQYVLGSFMFAFQTILDLGSVWLLQPLNQAATEAEMMLIVEQLATNPILLSASILSFVLLLAHILLGAKGNHLYLHHCTKRIKKAREETADLSAAELASFGGVSMGAAILIYLLGSLITNGFITFLLQ